MSVIRTEEELRALIGEAPTGLQEKNIDHLDHFAGKHHFLGKKGRFLSRHTLKKGRHHPGRLLKLGHFLVQNGIYDKTNLLGSEFASVPFLLNQV